jgi:DNA-binding GntR family transcriptional regulator
VSTAVSVNESIACDHGLRRQTIVESLSREIVLGAMRPGQHLVTQALAQRFGVSHTPIREGLIALAGMGLVDLKPNRGAVVRRVTAADVREICQVRRALECEAVSQACGRIDPRELAALQGELKRMLEMTPPFRPSLIVDAREIDSRLHDRIAASCGNGFLAKELTRLKILFRAFRDSSWVHDEARDDYRRVGDEAREHLGILDALKANQPRNASLRMSRHIMAGSRYWTRELPEESAAPRP